jgi:hypothetical protein
MTLLTDDFLLELIGNVQTNLARQGFYDLSKDDMQSLWESEGHRAVRFDRIHHFANACGARLEADANLSRARLVSRADNDLAPRRAAGERAANLKAPFEL